MSTFNQNECPICMEVIDVSKKCVTTECGHCFHANCLMTSVAHNGFGCPYCRTAMAQEVKNEDDDEWSENEDEEEEEDPYNDDIMRGFRLFMNNINGTPHDDDDVSIEREWIVMLEESQRDDNNVRPSVEFVHQKLIDQGITMNQLVKILLRDHDEYERDDEEFERVDDEIWGKVRVIISNYTPQRMDQIIPV